MIEREKWLLWANELNALAQAGIYYGQNVFDRERYERVAAIAAEIVSDYAALPAETVRDLFSNDTGYITPKLDTRSAIIEDGRVLLIQEAAGKSAGKWALPGGWVEQDLSVYENAVKEAREEAGLTVEPERLVAVIDRDRHNEILFPRKIIMVFVLCRRLGGAFTENSETVRSGWFTLDALPELARTKTTEEELRLCFEAHADPHWKTVFD